jgi:two-component system sensor histidine kinase ChvG
MASSVLWRFGLRSKLLLLSLLLLPLPWFGYQYIREMETTLQQGQEQMVATIAQALALTLNDKPELFNNTGSRTSDAGTRLYVNPLTLMPDVLDGTLADWREFRQHELALHEGSAAPYSGNQYTSFRGRRSGGDPLELRLLVGEAGNNLYLYVRVLDRNVVLAPSARAVKIEGSDALVLALVARDGNVGRYRISPAGGGPVTVWAEADDRRDAGGYGVEPRISGRYTATPEGYEYELSLPIAMADGWLAIAVEDVDDEDTGSLAAIVASGDMTASTAALQRPSSELEKLLAAQHLTNFRVRVYDRGERLLYQSGDIRTATGVAVVPSAGPDDDGLWYWLRTRALHPLYDGLLAALERATAPLAIPLNEQDSPQLLAAITGAAQSGYRTDAQSGVRSLETAWPIVAGGNVVGAVVVDQNLDGLRSARNQSLASLFDAMLAILLLTMAALVVFAGSLSQRIRRLRDQAEYSIDEHGRLQKTLQPLRSNDEIGDLSRSIANMLERLGHYNQYLENLTARLSHELRTPVTVVRSSLENLSLLRHSDSEAEVYIQRAEEGISRLNLILTNMSEATRLEQILQGCEKEPLQLQQLAAACVEQYRQIYPAAQFNADISSSPVPIVGSAEHMVQLLDKVVANAVEFSARGMPIGFRCHVDAGEAVLSISNHGPCLDPAMKDRIFDSMVSVRPAGNKGVPHLGLGLHIARLIAEFHNGYIYAENLLGHDGVIVSVRLPLLRPHRS